MALTEIPANVSRTNKKASKQATGENTVTGKKKRENRVIQSVSGKKSDECRLTCSVRLANVLFYRCVPSDVRTLANSEVLHEGGVTECEEYLLVAHDR